MLFVKYSCFHLEIISKAMENKEKLRKNFLKIKKSRLYGFTIQFQIFRIR
jgi:hypothetical protein